MSDVRLGRLPGEDAGRDATHVAVVPVQAGVEMAPGAHCGVYSDGYAGPAEAKNIGIVDPFLTRPVAKGERFYLCLYPGSVTGLRHVYLHPRLDGDSSVTSRDWIELLAHECGMTYDRLMMAAEYWLECNEYTYDNSETYKRVKWEQWREFWHHYEIVTGKKVDDHEATFFTCSC